MPVLKTFGGRYEGGKRHGHWVYRCSCGKRVGGNAAKWNHRNACDGRYLTHSEEIELRRAEWEAGQ